MPEASGNTKMAWLRPVLIGLVGATLGYSLQYVLAVRQEEQKNVVEFRTTAYDNFFAAQAKLRQADALTGKGPEQEAAAAKLFSEYQLGVAQARYRIAAFSSKPVVEALTAFWEKYFPFPPCADRQKFIDDIQIYQQVRTEVFGSMSNEKVADATMVSMVMGCSIRK